MAEEEEYEVEEVQEEEVDGVEEKVEESCTSEKHLACRGGRWSFLWHTRKLRGGQSFSWLC